MGELQFYVIFNSIPVISGHWGVDSERLCAKELCLWLRRFCLKQELNSVCQINRPALNPLSYRDSFLHKQSQIKCSNVISRLLFKWVHFLGNLIQFHFVSLLDKSTFKGKNWVLMEQILSCYGRPSMEGQLNPGKQPESHESCSP